MVNYYESHILSRHYQYSADNLEDVISVQNNAALVRKSGRAVQFIGENLSNCMDSVSMKNK